MTQMKAKTERALNVIKTISGLRWRGKYGWQIYKITAY